MTGLAYAMRTLPTGTAYAVWVGISASLTVVYAIATGKEAGSVATVLLILGLIGCVVGPQGRQLTRTVGFAVGFSF